jgi:hypothetical protein
MIKQENLKVKPQTSKEETDTEQEYTLGTFNNLCYNLYYYYKISTLPLQPHCQPF